MAFDSTDLGGGITPAPDATLQQLIEARRLLAAGWTRRAFVKHGDDFAVAYCLVGALRVAAGESVTELHSYGIETPTRLHNYAALTYAREYQPAWLMSGWLSRPFKERSCGNSTLMYWNDYHADQEQVLKYLDRLIARRQRELRKLKVAA